MTTLDLFVTIPGLQFIAKEIFVNLDPKSLNSCRSVSKTWKEFIDQEKTLMIKQFDKIILHGLQKFTGLKSIKEVEKNTISGNEILIRIIKTKFQTKELSGVLEFVRKYWKNQKKCREMDRYWNLLHYSCYLGRDRIVLSLLSHIKLGDAEQVLDAQDRYGRTPLHLACKQGHFKVVQALLKYLLEFDQNQDISLNIRNSNDWSALHNACYFGHTKIVKLFFEYHKITSKIKFNQRNMAKSTALHLACANGHYDVVKLFFEHSLNLASTIDFNVRDHKGETPFQRACFKGRTDVVKLLLFHPKLNKKLNLEISPLDHKKMELNNYDEIIKLLTLENKIQNELKPLKLNRKRRRSSSF